MPAAIGATAIAWIARVLSARLVADRGDRERFYENYSDAGRGWKRSKLSHGASISPRTLHGLTAKMAAITAKVTQALFMCKGTSVYMASFRRIAKISILG